LAQRLLWRPALLFAPSLLLSPLWSLTGWHHNSAVAVCLAHDEEPCAHTRGAELKPLASLDGSHFLAFAIPPLFAIAFGPKLPQAWASLSDYLANGAPKCIRLDRKRKSVDNFQQSKRMCDARNRASMKARGSQLAGASVLLSTLPTGHFAGQFLRPPYFWPQK